MPVEADEVDAVMLASRVLVGISAKSIATLEDRVTLPQVRALVVLASLGPLNLLRLSEAMGVHASNATRACDRLVNLELVDRRNDPNDRRNVTLALTRKGQHVITTVMDDRRRAVEAVVSRMPADQRKQLATVLRGFADAAGEVPTPAVWTMGWPST
jgi:DNA-binding MarR family transcriptional regulator